MGGISAIASVNSIHAITRQLANARRRATLTPRAQALINIARREQKIENSTDKQYDLVYILKQSEYNPDLRMSLRSVERFCNYKNIWIIGYKPQWLCDVKFIPTVQTGTKWQNSCLNWETACKCPDISDDFILMNDDFIALRNIVDWQNELNVCLGLVEDEATRWAKKAKPSRWQNGFIFAKDLLVRCHAKKGYNYEAHTPIMVNKKDFLSFLELKPIKEFMQTPKVLHKRSLYKNIYFDQTPRKIKDVKINLGYDLSDSYLKENWLSVFDDVIGNDIKYPKVNKFLTEMFPNKSRYERY